MVSTTTLSVIGYFGYNEGRRLLELRSFDLLVNITSNKKKAIEEYFSQMQKQLEILAERSSTSGAIKDFSEIFDKPFENISPKAETELKKFYDEEYLKLLKYNAEINNFQTDFMPKSPLRVHLQHKYLAQNPNPLKFKYNYAGPKENTDKYDALHQTFHPNFFNYAQKFGIEDVLLVNMKGDVLYSVAKRADFATNLLEGTYKESSVAQLFRKVIAGSEEKKVYFQDYENYYPAYFEPLAFMGGVVIRNDQKYGVIIFQISTEKITNILTNNQKWSEDGLGTSGEAFLVGSDFKLRNRTRRSLEDPAGYYEALKTKVDKVTWERIRRLGTTIGFREYKVKATINAIDGKSGKETNVDFLGSEVLDVYMPLDFLGTRWGILTEMDGAEVFAATTDFRSQLLTISIGLFIAVTLLGTWLARSLAAPMRKIQKDITMLSEGQFPKKSEKIYKDELGKIDEALNILVQSMRNVAEFAQNIGRKNYDYQFKARSDKDILSNALLEMRDSLRTISSEEDIRSWRNTGLALFGDVLRENNSSLEILSKAIIAELVKYIDAKQGALFVFDDKTQTLKASSAYAYQKYRYLQQNFREGEGLVGQVYFEKASIYLTEIPADYSNIASGLGHIKPKCLFLSPMVADNKIYGVVEIASLNEIPLYQRNFIEEIAENIAITIANIKSGEDTKKLLIESQKAGEQLRQQEEEMRQNFEELMATQEDMRTRQQQIDDLIEHLQQMINDELEIDGQNSTTILRKQMLEDIQKQKNILLEKELDSMKKEKYIREKVEELGKNI
ncbi:MAG: HAMP domain-containing protein, partial [Bacteroidetes bacterium]